MSRLTPVKRMVEHAIRTFGRLDYAVNNAGTEGRLAPIMDLTEQDWDNVLDTNLKGVFLCLKHEARAILAGRHGGAIVHVGSINSFRGFPTGSACVSSKHALIGLTSSASAELAPQGIRVNIACPGFIGLRRAPQPYRQVARNPILRRRQLSRFSGGSESR